MRRARQRIALQQLKNEEMAEASGKSGSKATAEGIKEKKIAQYNAKNGGIVNVD